MSFSTRHKKSFGEWVGLIITVVIESIFEALTP